MWCTLRIVAVLAIVLVAKTMELGDNSDMEQSYASFVHDDASYAHGGSYAGSHGGGASTAAGPGDEGGWAAYNGNRKRLYSLQTCSRGAVSSLQQLHIPMKDIGNLHQHVDALRSAFSEGRKVCLCAGGARSSGNGGGKNQSDFGAGYDPALRHEQAKCRSETNEWSTYETRDVSNLATLQDEVRNVLAADGTRQVCFCMGGGAGSESDAATALAQEAAAHIRAEQARAEATAAAQRAETLLREADEAEAAEIEMRRQRERAEQVEQAALAAAAAAGPASPQGA